MDAQDFSWDERRLGAVSQSFSKADSHRLLLPKPIPLQPNAYYMISAIIKARSPTPNKFNGIFTPLVFSGGWPRLAGGSINAKHRAHGWLGLVWIWQVQQWVESGQA